MNGNHRNDLTCDEVEDMLDECAAMAERVARLEAAGDALAKWIDEDHEQAASISVVERWKSLRVSV